MYFENEALSVMTCLHKEIGLKRGRILIPSPFFVSFSYPFFFKKKVLQMKVSSDYHDKWNKMKPGDCKRKPFQFHFVKKKGLKGWNCRGLFLSLSHYCVQSLYRAQKKKNVSYLFTFLKIVLYNEMNRNKSLFPFLLVSLKKNSQTWKDLTWLHTASSCTYVYKNFYLSRYARCVKKIPNIIRVW